MCLSHLSYTVRPCLIHTCHAMLRSCRHSTAVERRPCCGLEKNGMVGAWYGHRMASVNQTRPHCVNQMGKTHSKSLAARHGHCLLCVNRPLICGEMKKVTFMNTNVRECRLRVTYSAFYILYIKKCS